MPDETPRLLLKILSGPHVGAEITVADGEYSIGRGDDCALILTDPLVADHHATLTVKRGVAWCEPAGGRVFLDDIEVPPGGLELPPFQAFGIGGTFIATGFPDVPWPEFSLPDLRLSRPEQRTEPETLVPEAIPEPLAVVPQAPSPKPQRIRRTRGLGFPIAAFVLLSAAGLLGLTSDWFTGGFESPPVSKDDPLGPLASVFQDRGGVVRLANPGERGRVGVEGVIPSPPQWRREVERLRSTVGVLVEEDGGNIRVDGLVPPGARPGPILGLTVDEESEGLLRIRGTLQGDAARSALSSKLKEFPGLQSPEVEGGPTRISGTIRDADVSALQDLLWRLGATTLTSRPGGQVFVDGYLRTGKERRAFEERIRSLPSPPSIEIVPRLRDMEGIVRVALEVVDAAELRLKVKQGLLGQLIVSGAVSPKEGPRWATLKTQMTSDLSRVLDIVYDVAVGNLPRTVAASPLVASNQSGPPVPGVIGARAGGPGPVVAAARPLMPRVRSLHVGSTRGVTFHDGRNLGPGSEAGDGVRLTEIREGAFVLVDREGRRWDYPVSARPEPGSSSENPKGDERASPGERP